MPSHHDNESARHAWVRAKLAALPSGARLLDAGAGERPYRADCAHVAYTSQDFAQYTGAGDGRGLQTGTWDQAGLDLVCDITAIPRPDASFDAVLCTEVFEHIPDPLAALVEFTRLLAPGGVLILTCPFASLTHFAPHHYATGFGRSFYEHHLPRLGYAIEELTLNGSYFRVLGQELRRVESVAGRYAPSRRPAPWTRWLDKAANRRLRRLLDALDRADTGSSELSCFGVQVLARRTIAP